MFKSSKGIITALVGAVALYAASAQAQTFSNNQTGTNNGFYYSLWSNGQGSVSMTLGSAGNYSTNWSNIGDFTSGKGWSTGSARNIGYNAGVYNNSGGGSLAVYGWTTNPLVEYYVAESWNGLTQGTNMGTYTSDGATYTIWKHQQVNQPSIIGTATFWQYISVRNSQRTAGTITMQNHFNAWASKGMNLGTQNMQIMLTEGWNGSGQSNVTVWDAGSGGGSSSSSSSSSSGGGGSGTITVRARGTGGGEQIQLVAGSTTLATWTLTTSYQNYTVNSSATSGILVKYINDSANHDVQVDYVVVGGVTKQAEDQSYNTGVYQSGACGGGNGHSEWLNCNGAIGF